MSIEETIDDGTLKRKCTIRIREKGIKEILRGLGPDGFCSLGSGRLMVIDGKELFFEFCANVGTYESRVLALGIAFEVPLTDAEQNYTPPEPTPDEKEIHEESPAVAVDPDPPQLP